MTTSRSTTGKTGETIASKYLEGKGYKILERNHRQKYGELDIVATAQDGTLVLIEVKTVSGEDPAISAEDQMTSAKIDKFNRAAYAYANHYFKNKDDSKGFRLDLVTVNLNGNPSTVSGRASCRIKHYKNIS